jgi:hypothetical protein
MRGKE